MPIPKEGYIAVYKSTDEPIYTIPRNVEIGIHYPVFDNPLDAYRFGELNTDRDKYYVSEIVLKFQKVVL
jgi:hypothetical protein